MARYLTHVKPPTFVLDRDYDDREKWALGQEKFRLLAEELRIESKENIDRVYDGDTLAARQYTHDDSVRINFYEGYIPDEFDKSESNA